MMVEVELTCPDCGRINKFAYSDQTGAGDVPCLNYQNEVEPGVFLCEHVFIAEDLMYGQP